MSDDLQSLLDRINREGLERAEAEKKRILDEARTEALRIVEEARTESERLIEQARQEAANLKERGSEALRQAARNTLLSLRSQLQKRLFNVVRACVGEAMTAELMAELIREMTAAYAKQGFKIDRLSVLLPEERLEALRDGLLARLGEDLRNRTDLQPQAGRHGGFQLSFNGQDVVYDFTDDALAEVLCAYLNPALAELVVAEAAAAT
ncbi:MAG: hypothetical protein GXP31_07660 [Kiritimatiellaeota bacterium]|nr:hypothetical protein [Kiritimatiellota bacterium]